jgi:hypothetical protein
MFFLKSMRVGRQCSLPVALRLPVRIELLREHEEPSAREVEYLAPDTS